MVKMPKKSFLFVPAIAMILSLFPATHSVAVVDAETCLAGHKTGAMDFNPEGSRKMKFCNGSGYTEMSAGGNTGRSCSVAGRWQWYEDYNSIVWCDGTNWFAMTPVAGDDDGTGDGTDCSALDPLLAGTQGTLQFHEDENVYYLCNGSGWISVVP